VQKRKGERKEMKRKKRKEVRGYPHINGYESDL
jgi:hypothetical protein